MSRKSLNLGILAHVDAGKTTLTERLLYDSGVISQLGAVDAGTTQTDSLALERRRGITIKSAVASFPIGDVLINLIDTPGHPDFIAEVDRVLSVLDGVVLVISAVEGVQAQTRILMRSLQRLQLPALLFVNKIDRAGADPGRVLSEIGARLRIAACAMGSVTAAGTPGASFAASGPDDEEFAARLTELLADQNDELMASYVLGDARIPYRQLQADLVSGTRRCQIYPTFFGSALTGAGIQQLTAGVATLLPAAAGDPTAPLSGRIFKIERGGGGEKVAYARLFSGTIQVRDRLTIGAGFDDRVTSIAVFERGPAVRRAAVRAGQIGKLWGLANARIGDPIGTSTAAGDLQQFPPPTLESAVVPCDPDDKNRLRVALGQLAEQDPLINVRQDDDRHELYVSLYGAVQREVIEATLAGDFDVRATFREPTMICIERPVGSGSALKVLYSDDHPYPATVGLRIEAAPAGARVGFRLDFDPRLLPLHIYKNADHFAEAMKQYVLHTFEHGLHGWQVTDCLVTMTDCGYYVGDGPRKKVLPMAKTTAAHFRKLTPLVLAEALTLAGTVVCQPMASVRLELPATKISAVLSALTRIGTRVESPSLDGESAVITALLPSPEVRVLQERLPGLTGGEGVADIGFGGYEAVDGDIPVRGS